MSFVGPRPALFNQDDLIALRTEKGVHLLIPGITGCAQINGRKQVLSEETKKGGQRSYYFSWHESGSSQANCGCQAEGVFTE